MPLSSLFVAALALSAGTPEVLQFTSPHCPACQTMAPVFERLAGQGVTVTKVDVDVRPDLAKQFNITMLPTTVVIRDGREADRVVGAAGFDHLCRMVQGEPQAAPPAGAGYAGAGPGEQGGSPTANPSAGDLPQQRAFAATVRLRVLDQSGQGVGTGTIIDMHGDEALVMTCGHIFRASQGKGKITAELFAPGARGPVAGHLIDFDLERDVALVSIRPGFAIEPVPVAGPQFKSKIGDRVFTIGCNKGADPTVQVSQVATVDKYQGHPNVTVKGMPIDGRSGGGLFSADGHLIGVCNAADAQDNEGLYASLPAVHWQLDRINQARIYQKSNLNGVGGVAAAFPREVTADIPSPTPQMLSDNSKLGRLGTPPNMPERMPSRGNSAVPAAFLETTAENQRTPPASGALPPLPMQQPTPAAPRTGGEEFEVVCLVRPKGQPNAQPQVVVLDRMPAELRERLAAVPRPAAAPSSAGNNDSRLATRPTPNDGMIIRGQGQGQGQW